MMFLEDVFEEELGATPSKKKKKKKSIGSKIKRGLKAVASGGMSEAARAAKKTKLGRKVMKGAAAVMSGGASLAISAAKKKIISKAKKSKVGKIAGNLITKRPVKMTPLKAKATIEAVKSVTAGQCSCKDDMAKLVAAKLIAELGPPLNQANKALAKLELQRKATYEHKKLMSDAEFRRKVLEFIAKKANGGNKSAKRTIKCLRG